jgi:hypothetical protein
MKVTIHYKDGTSYTFARVDFCHVRRDEKKLIIQTSKKVKNNVFKKIVTELSSINTDRLDRYVMRNNKGRERSERVVRLHV